MTALHSAAEADRRRSVSLGAARHGNRAADAATAPPDGCCSQPERGHRRRRALSTVGAGGRAKRDKTVAFWPVSG